MSGKESGNVGESETLGAKIEVGRVGAVAPRVDPDRAAALAIGPPPQVRPVGGRTIRACGAGFVECRSPVSGGDENNRPGGPHRPEYRMNSCRLRGCDFSPTFRRPPLAPSRTASQRVTTPPVHVSCRYQRVDPERVASGELEWLPSSDHTSGWLPSHFMLVVTSTMPE